VLLYLQNKRIGVVRLFVCIECGETFLEPARWTEDRGEYFGFPTSEEFVGCPYCNAPYTEAHRCDCCEEWITGDYIKTDDGRRYCDNCITPMKLGDE
jgi:formylmethanofuran dehydrogenase subunit E